MENYVERLEKMILRNIKCCVVRRTCFLDGTSVESVIAWCESVADAKEIARALERTELFLPCPECFVTHKYDVAYLFDDGLDAVFGE